MTVVFRLELVFSMIIMLLCEVLISVPAAIGWLCLLWVRAVSISWYSDVYLWCDLVSIIVWDVGGFVFVDVLCLGVGLMVRLVLTMGVMLLVRYVPVNWMVLQRLLWLARLRALTLRLVVVVISVEGRDVLHRSEHFDVMCKRMNGLFTVCVFVILALLCGAGECVGAVYEAAGSVCVD